MRGGKVFLIVGGRGSGKTTWIETHVPPAAAVVVEMFVVADRYRGFDRRRRFDDLKISECVNRRIILEDATQLIMGGASLRVRKLVVSSKQIGSDIFIVFHSLNVVPPFLLAMFDYIVLFKSEPPTAAKLAPYLPKIQQLMKLKKKKYEPLGVIEQL